MPWLDTPAMEPRNRFAVPSDNLDAVRVDHTEQVQEQIEPRAPESGDWGGRLPPAHGGGGGATADGE
jgi:hypothetical protein